MVQTVLLDLPTAFTLGHVFALLGRKALLRDQKFADVGMRPLAFVLLYAIVIFMPITGYYCFAYPVWSFSYLWEESRISVIFCLLAVMGYLWMMLAGWIHASFWILRRSPWVAILSMLWGAAATGAVLLLTYQEYMHIGSYGAFHQGTAPSLFENRVFFWKMNILGAILVLATLLFGFFIWKQSQKYNAQIRI